LSCLGCANPIVSPAFTADLVPIEASRCPRPAGTRAFPQMLEDEGGNINRRWRKLFAGHLLPHE
jgi:hypothetical protein